MEPTSYYFHQSYFTKILFKNTQKNKIIESIYSHAWPINKQKVSLVPNFLKTCVDAVGLF